MVKSEDNTAAHSEQRRRLYRLCCLLFTVLFFLYPSHGAVVRVCVSGTDLCLLSDVVEVEKKKRVVSYLFGFFDDFGSVVNVGVRA